MPRDQAASSVHALNPDTAAFLDRVRREKYMLPTEDHWHDAHNRVAATIFSDDPARSHGLASELYAGRACPGGRVMAGAGTDRNVTWWNCFISPLLQDSMRTDPERPGKGIMDALADVAVSMQMGGGVGTDFSPLRPAGCLVRRVQAPASGPLPFMDTWDAMCRTVMSAGYRRGAMMATLRCDHPDILEFIRAKRTPGRLEMFNVSVLVTDALMQAVEADGSFDLGHWEPPGSGFERPIIRVNPYSGKSQPWFIHKTVRARELWDEIMETTYRYAEPGVIFIDRANAWNNLWYAEHLQCANPCGEQLMAPDDNCNLAHVNLARCVAGGPFKTDCRIDSDAINRTTRLLVRMADRVIDLSPAPTEEQRAAARAKRRIGLGITGLGTMLMFLGQRYGSPAAIYTIETVMAVIRRAAYLESIALARELGPFPAFDREQYLKGRFVRGLPEDVRDGIAEHGIRNALLLTVAPVGTMTNAQADNASSGLEPTFLPRYRRRMLAPDGSFTEHVVEDLGFRVYANTFHGGDFDAMLRAELPGYMVTTADLTAEDHLLTQAAVQGYVDNSISKTINLPEVTSFEDFQRVYLRAYELGCKGCTTYRPDPTSGRGAVLSAVDDEPVAEAPPAVSLDGDVRPRPDVLEGRTYRLRWGTLPYPMFVTINDEVRPDGTRLPFEMFVNSKAVDYAHWVSALTRMITAVMRKGGDLRFIPDELKQVWSARGGEFRDRRYVPSEVALIGYTIEEHFYRIGYLDRDERLTPDASTERPTVEPMGFAELGGTCPACNAPAVVSEEGCKRCKSCGWSNCG